MPIWNQLANHYDKIPHSEHVTIAKVRKNKDNYFLFIIWLVFFFLFISLYFYGEM